MSRLIERALIAVIAGMVVCYGGGTLWHAIRAAYPPAEPTVLDLVRVCGYEGRRRVGAPSPECGAVFHDAERQLGAQQFVLRVAESHQADGLCAREFVEMGVVGRAAEFAVWAASLPPGAQRSVSAHRLIQTKVRTAYRYG